jgi:hypothetical protein
LYRRNLFGVFNGDDLSVGVLVDLSVQINTFFIKYLELVTKQRNIQKLKKKHKKTKRNRKKRRR